MYRKLFILFLVVISGMQFAQKKEIAAVMDAQAVSWNNGDLEGYMQGYWNSNEMMFIGKNGPTYGWQKTLDNYKKSYSTKEKMGILSFSEEKIDLLGENYAHVFGRWKITRAAGDLEGIYTLVFQKFGKDWKIISDHTQ